MPVILQVQGHPVGVGEVLYMILAQVASCPLIVV